MGGWSGVGWIWELCPGAGCGRETGMDENMELGWERSKMAVVKVGHWHRFEVLVSGRRDIRLWRDLRVEVTVLSESPFLSGVTC